MLTILASQDTRKNMPQKEAPWNDRTLLWLSVATFSSMASMRFTDSMLPALATDFFTTAGHAGLAISAFAIAYGALQLFYGPMGDRYGKFKVASLATAACTAGCIAAALSPSLDWLSASRALSGATAAGIIPLTIAWIGDNVPYARRQEILARLLTATVSGTIAGQWLGGLFADTVGWRTGFVLLALLFAVTSLFMCLELRQQNTRSQPTRTSAPGDTAVNQMRYILREPWARRILLITCTEGALAFSTISFVPSHLHMHFDLSMGSAGAVLALFGAGGLVYSRCARTLVQRFGEAGLARLGAGLLAVAFGMLALLPSWHWALPACLLGGLGFYSLHNTLQTQATQMVRRFRGTAVSLFAGSMFLGQSIGVLVASVVINRSSAIPVFAASGLGILILGIVFAALLRKRPQQR